MRAFVAGLLALGLSATTARADEQLTPLAESGDWSAVAHRPDMLSPADMCLAADMDAGVAFRATQDGTALRVMNHSWSLPTGASGTVLVKVGDFSKTFDSEGVDSTMIEAELDPDDVQSLFAAMDKASSMTVTVGKSKPVSVSLAGSTKVTNAFRTCAGIHGSAPSGGVNPFN